MRLQQSPSAPQKSPRLSQVEPLQTSVPDASGVHRPEQHCAPNAHASPLPKQVSKSGPKQRVKPPPASRHWLAPPQHCEPEEKPSPHTAPALRLAR